MHRLAPVAAALLFTAAVAFAELADTLSPSPDHPAIAYRQREANDPVARLNARLREGTAQLRFTGESGYLRSVLDALHIPVESQLLGDTGYVNL